MTQVKVNASSPYNVIVSRGISENAGLLSKEVIGNCRIAIITDKNVEALYLKALKLSYENAGYEVFSFAFEGGEDNKTFKSVEKILEFLTEHEFTRSDALAALGGGIVGDITAFAASVYLRGIRYIQIPTTLLSSVDSSVGGKTGVNLCKLKNQVGTFYQPSLVICDPDMFDTLPEREYANGFAEIIKYGMIASEELAKALTSDFDICDIIAKCVKIKADLVEKDEFDCGARQLLNFGHTLGHAVEKCSGYEIPHGMAVAIGMQAITKSTYIKGLCTQDVCDFLSELLKLYHLPLYTDISKGALLDAALHDKKRKGNDITLVIPEKIGHCVLYSLPISEFGDFLGTLD